MWKTLKTTKRSASGYSLRRKRTKSRYEFETRADEPDIVQPSQYELELYLKGEPYVFDGLEHNFNVSDWWKSKRFKLQGVINYGLEYAIYSY